MFLNVKFLLSGFLGYLNERLLILDMNYLRKPILRNVCHMPSKIMILMQQYDGV